MAPRIEAVCGRVETALADLADDSLDAIITDPPYLISFMSRSFDQQHKEECGANDGQRMQAWHQAWLKLALPKLRPGGRLIAASSSRTYHRLATSAEDAGFSIDPMFQWINGEAMAQGLAIDKAIDKAAGAEREVISFEAPGLGGGAYQRGGGSKGAGAAIKTGTYATVTAPATPLARLFAGYSTRLKDCLTPFLMAHRPPCGPWARNAAEHGLAGLNVDGGRVPTEGRPAIETGEIVGGPAAFGQRSRAAGTTTLGRHPANLALSEDAAAELGRQSGALRSGSMKPGGPRSGRITYNEGDRGSSVHPDGDEGDASRFFHRFRYNAKTARAERMKGCEGFFWRIDKDHPLGFERITQAEYLAMGHLPGCRKRRKFKPAGGGADRHRGRNSVHQHMADYPDPTGMADEDLPLFESVGLEIADLPEPGCIEGCQHRQRYQGCTHPCLKPIALIEYLARLVLPPSTGRPRRVLVPFAGTFSEVIGCALAGFDEVVAIEAEPTYIEIGEARAAAWLSEETSEQLEILDT